LKSDTFELGNGYKIYYERESIYVGLMFIFMITIGFSFVSYLGYKVNRNRLLDVRLRRLYAKSKKAISEVK